VRSAKSQEIAGDRAGAPACAFQFETTFRCGTRDVGSTLERALIHREPGVSAWNAAPTRGAPISNDFS